MTTQYSMSDTLSKDAGGAKFAGLIDDQTSQLDFGLPRGIARSSEGATSRVLLHQAVGSHVTGSAIGASAALVVTGGVYTESPSGVGTANAQIFRTNNQGAQYVTPASGILSYSAASVQTHIAGSALLNDLWIRFNDATAGDSVIIDDGTSYRFAFVATTASQYFAEHFSAGQVFNTSIKHTSTFAGAGTASVTVSYGAF